MKLGVLDLPVAIEETVELAPLVDELGFEDYVVSIKDSDPRLVVAANVRFAEARPDVHSTWE